MASVTNTTTSYPTSYAVSGSSISGTKYRNCIGKGSDTSAVSGNDYASGNSSSIAYIDYSFEFDEIPDGATINSVTCTVKGHCENTSRSTAKLQLYAGSTAKGSESKFTSTSAQVLTLSTGAWTAEEIPTMKLRFTIGYYGGLVNGATVTVSYTYNDTTWIITVSGDGATPQGNTEVRDGESFTVRIDSEAAPHVTDNGTDVSNRVVTRTDSNPTYTVERASGTNYEFVMNSSGYYESNNQGVSNSAAVSIVTINSPVRCKVTFTVINYAEDGYDFGLLGNVDEPLSTEYAADSSSYWSGKNDNSRYEQTVTYSEVPAGEHEIYVKFFKDTYTDENNDSLQFKVLIEPLEEISDTPYYIYEISSVKEAHVIVVGPSETLYIKVNGSWAAVDKVYKKVNGAWVEQSDLASVFNTGYAYVHKS